MRPFSLGVTTLVHGFYSMVWVALVLDVGSPSFNLSMPEWTATEAAVWIALLLTGAAALGVVVQTISRSVFHGYKEAWALEVLVSPTVQQRFAAFGSNAGMDTKASMSPLATSSATSAPDWSPMRRAAYSWRPSSIVSCTVWPLRSGLGSSSFTSLPRAVTSTRCPPGVPRR